MSTSDAPLIRHLVIRGDGVAARCCAHLLGRSGFRVALKPIDRPRVPAIMVGDAAAALMRDVFELPSLFADATRIAGRTVVWGAGTEARPLPYSAVVLSEEKLLASLGPRSDDALAGFAPDFTIYASGALPSTASYRSFGSRRASAARVTLGGPRSDSAYIESLDSGWLFLAPDSPMSAWLLAIGAPLESQLAQSHVIRPLIASLEPLSGEFPACPRIALPLYGPNWLACGTAALAFDPICGDGTADAVREAILASAVIRAIAKGGHSDSLMKHYETRLLSGMQRHLALCAGFYRTGGGGPWWKDELQSLLEGFQWCAAKLAEAPAPSYQLRGFELEARTPTMD